MTRPTAKQTKAQILHYYTKRRLRNQWLGALFIASAAPWFVRENLTLVVVSATLGVVAVIITATRFSNAEETYNGR